jgi:8-oxo-dGTP pyrophosphatase MutT (NUDIX family)
MTGGTSASAAEPRASAAVILVRAVAAAGAEVYLVRRGRGASFMSGAFVFPGGVAEPGEADLRLTAARELEEEAGVVVRAEELRWFAHWITPSVEPRRYSAQFYLAALPAGQTPAFDNRETVDDVWVTPAAGLAGAEELRLPPPQLRSLLELAPAAERGVDALFALCDARARTPHPILPRACQTGAGFTLLLPWDPEYESLGTGEKLAMPPGHPLATGPSRFVREGNAWLHQEAGGRA